MKILKVILIFLGLMLLILGILEVYRIANLCISSVSVGNMVSIDCNGERSYQPALILIIPGIILTTAGFLFKKS